MLLRVGAADVFAPGPPQAVVPEAVIRPAADRRLVEALGRRRKPTAVSAITVVDGKGRVPAG